MFKLVVKIVEFEDGWRFQLENGATGEEAFATREDAVARLKELEDVKRDDLP
jgi:hypothetical protein